MNRFNLRFADVQVGDELPVLALPPVSRLDLALYCGASGDHNPIHVDLDFARAAGMSDVFAQGMLSMAWLARLLTDWVPQERIRRYNVRFTAITQLGDVIHCRGRVIEKIHLQGEACVRLAVSTSNQAGEIRLTGEAWVALPE